MTLPSTSACPLLPGQTVNILEVPMEVVAAPNRACSASADAPSIIPPVMTTNPEDRYKKIHRKPPTKLPRYYCSADALREKADDNSAHQIGGPVQMFSRMEEAFLPPVRYLKRVRNNDKPYHQPGPCLTSATPAGIGTMAKPTPPRPAGNGLPELRSFAPSCESLSDTRPLTRTGGASNSLIGLGISHFGAAFPPAPNVGEHDAMEVQEESNSDVFNDTPQCPPAPRIPSVESFSDDFFQSRLMAFPAPPTHENSWPFAHPNPLRANPTPPIDPHPSTFAASASSNQVSNVHLHYSPVTTPSPSLSYHPGFVPNTISPPSGSGASLFDMCSPTFTAETISSMEGDLSTPGRFRLSEQCYGSPDDDSSHDQNNDRHCDRFGELSNQLSRLTSSEDFVYEDGDHEASGHPLGPHLELKRVCDEVNASALALKPFPTPQTNARPQNERPGFDYAAVDQTGRLSLLTPARNMTSSDVVEDDFASSVFGALGIAI